MTSTIHPQPKPERIIIPEYGEWIRTKPCCLSPFFHDCESMNRWPHISSEAHHVSPRNGTKGMSSKADDPRQVPVCFNGHRYCEAHPLKVLPFLERKIAELNAEFDALYPNVRPRQKKPMPAIAKAERCPTCKRPLTKLQLRKARA